MRVLLTTIILFSSLNCWAFNHDIVKGQWAVYQENPKTNNKLSYGDFYYYLDINNDFSGTFIRYLGRGEPKTRTFKPSAVKKHDGFIEIQLNKSEKAVLSAWKINNSGALVGVIYLYNEKGVLFNMLHFPLELVSPDHKILKRQVIKKYYEKYR